MAPQKQSRTHVHFKLQPNPRQEITALAAKLLGELTHSFFSKCHDLTADTSQLLARGGL